MVKKLPSKLELEVFEKAECLFPEGGSGVNEYETPVYLPFPGRTLLERRKTCEFHLSPSSVEVAPFSRAKILIGYEVGRKTIGITRRYAEEIPSRLLISLERCPREEDQAMIFRRREIDFQPRHGAAFWSESPGSHNNHGREYIPGLLQLLECLKGAQELNRQFASIESDS